LDLISSNTDLDIGSTYTLVLSVAPYYRLGEESADLADSNPEEARENNKLSEFAIEYQCLSGSCLPIIIETDEVEN
jgi:hypothetical protein